MAEGPSPYDFEPFFTEEETREMENRHQRERYSSASSGTGSEQEIEQDRRTSTNWCQCGSCIAMPTLTECKCCREVRGIGTLAADAGFCITNHDDFRVMCLHRSVLRATAIMRNDIRGHVANVPHNADHK